MHLLHLNLLIKYLTNHQKRNNATGSILDIQEPVDLTFWTGLDRAPDPAPIQSNNITELGVTNRKRWLGIHTQRR